MTSETPHPRHWQSTGRTLLWWGIGLALIGLPLIFLQFTLKYLFVPWYSPALATVGAALILLSITRRQTVVRYISLILVVAFAGFQWFFHASMMKLPDYTGPVTAGERLPAFASTFADGRPFTEADLQDGSRRVLVFFRGRW